MKFGLLYNNGGKWEDKQVVSQEWIEKSFQSHVQRPGGGSYGYQFWLWQDTIENKIVPFVFGIGNGDQKIIFDKTHNLVIVVTAGNYNKWDIKKNAYALFKEYICPALIKK